MTTRMIRKLGLAGYLLLIALLAIPTLARADDAVTLKAAIQVNGESVLLSDLFEGVPAERDATVARAPDPGASLSLDPGPLQRVARRQGLFWANAERVTRVTVRRPSQSVSAEALATLIADALSRRELASYAVTPANLQPLHAPVDVTLAPDVVAISLDGSTRTFVAEVVLAPGLPPQRIIGRAEPSVALPVLNRAIARGAAIGEADVGFVETPATRVPADALTDPSQIVGLAARRALRPGVAIRSFDLAQPTVIARGEVVVVRFEYGALALTARARALDDVAQGQQARFVNLQSSRVIEAVATGPGEAWLVAAAPGGGAGGSR